MTKPTILVVDDEPAVRQVLSVLLEEEGFIVTQADNGNECLRLAYDRHPDLVLLDILMPSKDGREVCRRLREMSEIPVIMLSALPADREAVGRLSDGADDYVSKPFKNDELVARIRAVLRRTHHSNLPVVPAYDDGYLCVDFETHKVRVNGENVPLPPRQWRLLEYLIKHPNRIITRQQLLRHVWGDGYEAADSYVKVFISNLRQKLHDSARRPHYIHTERELGYRFETHN